MINLLERFAHYYQFRNSNLQFAVEKFCGKKFALRARRVEASVIKEIPANNGYKRLVNEVVTKTGIN
jgi:hypothetical protein